MAERIPMGIGHLGFKNTRFKLKNRFTFELFDICGDKSIPKHHVKSASRPKLVVEDKEINFLNARTWIPAKAYWEPITVTYYDLANDEMKSLYDWLASIYDFTDPVNLKMGSIRSDYTATGVLKLWDGCGSIIETWNMSDVFPTNIDWGELDYESGDPLVITLTLRYSNVEHINHCPGFTIDPCCTPCDSVPNN